MTYEEHAQNLQRLGMILGLGGALGLALTLAVVAFQL